MSPGCVLSLEKLLGSMDQHHFKVITEQNQLNLLAKTRLVTETEDLDEFQVSVKFGKINIMGIVNVQGRFARRIGLGRIYFNIMLVKEEVRAHEIHLNIRRFEVNNPEKSPDPVKIFSIFSNLIKHRILYGLCEGNSPFFIVEPYRVIGFDLSQILQQIPSEVNLLGGIRILNIALEEGRIIWYIQSNLILRSLIDYLGPQYLSVEKLEENADALRLLTDFDFNFSEDGHADE